MTLKDIGIGQTARVLKVGGDGALRQHFLDMGLIPGVELIFEKYAPMGDPMQFRIHGYELTLRKADAANIDIETLSHAMQKNDFAAGHIALWEDDLHPGLGEGAPYHSSKEEHPLPDDTLLSFALVGNQNCGKTMLFNQLTGANQHVGNFPGVTVDYKSGAIRGHAHTLVTDLPGIYSLSPYSNEELVSRNFIFSSRPKGIINIVDATNIERNLYLTMQLMELGIPMVLALNMMDEVKNNGGTIRINEMERLLGIPVVPISALHNEGVEELVEHAIHVAHYQEAPSRKDFCDPEECGGAVHRCLHAVMHLVEDHAHMANIPLRFAAGKLIEGDKLVEESLHLSANERETVAHILCQLEEERGLDPSAAMADMRFNYIGKVCRATVVKPSESKEHRRSRRIDRILTGRWTALPAFLGLMALMFWLTFDLLGGTLQGQLEELIEGFNDYMDGVFASWQISGVVRSLLVNGVFNGIGSVLTFVPIIVFLFLFLSLFEDSGYMARIAFVMDKLLRKIGLSGRSIVPLLMGFGCSVPSVMASRTLPSERDRRLTVMLTPFMSCTAKLPIYAFFTVAFFPNCSAKIMVLLYFIGILVGILVAFVLKKTLFRGEAVPFVMELPNYRMPSMKSVLRLVWDKTRDFLQRAFTVIFLATIVIWFLQTFDFHLNMVSDSRQSILASVAGLVSPIFSPMGFGDWRISTALVTGFMAKESVVSTLSVLFGSGQTLLSVVSMASAFSLLVFCLLYTPCVATIATVRQELGGRYAFLIVVWQCLLAWVVSLVAYWVVNLLF